MNAPVVGVTDGGLAARCPFALPLLAALAFLALAPAASLAQDAEDALPRAPDVPAGDDVMEALSAGDEASFEGILLSTDTAIRWTNRIGWYRHELRLTLDEWTTRERAMTASHERELTLVRESFEREIDGLRTDLTASVERYEAELAEARRDPPFYETWGFAFGMGVLVTGVLVGVVAGLVAGL